MNPRASRLAARIEALTHEQLIEVECFVEGLEAVQQDRLLKRDFARLSEPAFAKIWDKDRDDVYDAL